MIKQYNSGQILKGSDVEIAVPLATCRLDVDVRDAQDLVVSIYTTPGGYSIQKTIDDIELNEKGDAGLIHYEWEELDGFDDGVVKYNVFYVYDGNAVEFEGSTGYYLKTPIDYTPTTFVSEQNLDELVEDKLVEEGTATEDYVDNVIAEAVSGLASEEYVSSAITEATSGLASEDYVQSAITSAVSQIDDYCYFAQGYMMPWDIDNIDDLIDWANQYPNDYQKLRVFIACDEHGSGGYREFHIISLSSTQMRLYSNLEGSYDKIGEVYIGTLYKGRSSVPEDWEHFYINPEQYSTTGATAGAIAQAVDGLASKVFVNSAITEAVSGLASETYVQSAITSAVSQIDDYCIYLETSGSTQNYYDTPGSEVDRLLDYLSSLGSNFTKARIFIKISEGHYVEFRAAGLGYYDGFDAVFVYSVFDKQEDIFYNLNKVSFYFGKLERGRSIQRNQPDGGLRETTINASESDFNADTYTFVLPVLNTPEQRREIIAKAAEYHAAGKDYQGIRVVYDGHVYRIEAFIPMGSGQEYDEVVCTCLDASYMSNSRMYIRVIDFNTDMGNIVQERTETIDFTTFATTADTASLQTQINNLPASTAMTQAIESAITASNLVYALTGTNKIWAGTRAAYSAQTIDNTTLYFITD